MKKIISSLIAIFLITNISYTWAEDAPTYTDKTDFALYEDRVAKFCSEYNKTSNSELIYNIDQKTTFVNLDKNLNTKNNKEALYTASDLGKGALEKAKSQYQASMDGIYDCAIELTNYKSLIMVKGLIAKNPKLSAKSKKLENQIKESKNIIQNNCNIEAKEGDSLIKTSVLKQATYEFCRYNYYLEYLKKYYTSIDALKESL
jgi:hypothetical protein